MAVRVTPLSIEQALSRLQAQREPAGVLSVYLDTSRQGTERQAHRLALVSGIRALRPQISDSERDAFEEAASAVERFFEVDFSPSGRGVAVFATPSRDELEVVVLPRPPANRVSWGPSPRVEPLQEMVDELERVAVALLDKERARIFTILLGDIEEHREFQDAVPGKHASGGWFALSQSRFARHHEHHVLHHVERTIDALMELLRSRPFDRLIIGGPDEAVAMLREHLPGPLRTRLAGTLSIELFASDTEIRDRALEVAEAAERRSELAEVNALLDAASSRYVTLGVDRTLEAVSDGRVHTLFIADAFEAIGAECPFCGLLVAHGAECPRCGTPLTLERDLRERLVERALAQGARVEIVAGEASARLLKYEGLGAWTRY